MFDGLLFDLDGTLWDSVDAICVSWNRALAELAPEYAGTVTRERLLPCMGLLLPDILDRLIPGLEADRRLSALCAPGGESYEDLLGRCAEFSGELAALPENAAVLAVSHGITLRALVNFLLKRPRGDVDYLNWPENTAVTELEWQPGQPARLRCLFDDRHLREAGLSTPNYEEWGLFSERDYLSLG